MRRVISSELLKIARPRLLLLSIGVPAVLAALGTLFVVLRLPVDGEVLTDDGTARLPLSLKAIIQADGLTAGFRSVALQVAQAALCVYAVVVAAEYRHGTWKLLLVRQPSRFRLLAGKIVASAVLSTAAVLASLVTSIAITATLVVPYGDVSQWSSTAGVRAVAVAFLGASMAAIVAGVVGASLAVLLRSSAGAISVGLLWFLVGETTIMSIDATAGSAGDWLPGQLIRKLTSAGTFLDTGVFWVIAKLAVISFVMIACAYSVFRRRDMGS